MEISREELDRLLKERFDDGYKLGHLEGNMRGYQEGWNGACDRISELIRKGEILSQ